MPRRRQCSLLSGCKARIFEAKKIGREERERERDTHAAGQGGEGEVSYVPRSTCELRSRDRTLKVSNIGYETAPWDRNLKAAKNVHEKHHLRPADLDYSGILQVYTGSGMTVRTILVASPLPWSHEDVKRQRDTRRDVGQLFCSHLSQKGYQAFFGHGGPFRDHICGYRPVRSWSVHLVVAVLRECRC